jgi:hypothetical protein
MRTVTAVDLRTGAAIVLLATASCVMARRDDRRTEISHVDAADATPVGNVRAGALVYVEWAGRWAKMLIR